MELHIQYDFDCVLTINGDIFEGQTITMNAFDTVYVFVMPIGTTLLPYAVKFCGNESIKSELSVGVRLNDEHYLLLLKPRYMTVYAQETFSPPKSRIARLFAHIKRGDDTAAYAMLTDELKAQIDRHTLVDFFDKYDEIIECPWQGEGKFYLLIGCTAKLHTYTVKNEFIDDIGEE